MSKEKYKEFFTAIGRIDVFNDIMGESSYNCGEKHYRTSVVTREFGRYRSYVYREKMLRREICEKTAQRMKLEKEMAERGMIISPLRAGEYKRGRSEIINLWLELSEVMKKRRELEKRLEMIENSFVKKVCRQRYFSDSVERLQSWSSTARTMEIPMTGTQLQNYVTENLAELEMAN